MKKVKKQLAHLFDATQCINCGACTTACAQTNYPDLINEFIPAWNTVCNNIRQVKVEKNRPMQLLVQCQQCSEAPCVTTCPFGSNYYDENGLVRNDPKRCIGCNYCVASCPYDARWSNPKTGLPSKCMGEGCLELIKGGTRNIVCVQPFGCLPNHIVGKGMVNKIRALYPSANITPIDYDPSATKVNQENRIKLMLAVAKERLNAPAEAQPLTAEQLAGGAPQVGATV